MRKYLKKSSKFLSIVLAVAIIFSLFPTTIFAENESVSSNANIEQEIDAESLENQQENEETQVEAEMDEEKSVEENSEETESEESELSMLNLIDPLGAEEPSTYYVSNSGDDNADGLTEETAWATLAKVNATTFQPGEKILFKAGDSWTGQLHPQGSGESGSPISIDMYGTGAKPIINGNGSFGAETDAIPYTAGSAVLLYNQDYWEIKNLAVTNPSDFVQEYEEGWSWGNLVEVPKNTLEHKYRYGFLIRWHDYGTGQHVYIEDCDIYDVNGLLWRFESEGILVVSTGTRGGTQTNFNDVKIANNTIKDINRTGISIWSQWAERNGFTYEEQGAGQERYYHNTYGPWKGSTNVVVEGNYLENIAGDGILVNTTDGAIIQHNITNKCQAEVKIAPNVAIWPHNADNTIMQYNEVYGTLGTGDGQGLDVDFECKNTMIQYNYSHDNEGGFLLIMNGVKGTTARYNISQNDQYYLFDQRGDGEYYNNTFYMKPGVGIFRNIAPSKAVLKNNIFAYTEPTNATGWTVGSNISYFNNLYHNTGTTPADRNKIVADPLFTDPGKGGTGTAGNSAIGTVTGYSLAEGSPAINTGLSISNNGGKDYFGTALDDVQDIGAVDSATPGGEVPENWVVTASSSHENWGWYRECLIDGLLASLPDQSINGYHSSGGEASPWVAINFGKEKTLQGIMVYPAEADTFPSKITVETWDGTQWVKQVEKDGITLDTLNPQMVVFPSEVTTKEVRFTATDFNKDLRLAEIEIVEKWNTEEIIDEFNDTSKLVYISPSMKIEVGNEFNGGKNSLLIDPPTLYSKANSNVIYHMPNMEQIKVTANLSGGSSTDSSLKCFTSEDGLTYQEQTSTTTANGNELVYLYEIADLNQNFVKFIFPNGNAQGWEFALNKVEITGKEVVEQKPATYYIDATSGSDAFDGKTPETAWQSLDKVNATTFIPGDKILFKANEYWSGQLAPKGSGDENASIIIDMYGDGDKPIIDGNGRYSISYFDNPQDEYRMENDFQLNNGAAVLLFNQDYWEINNLAVTNKSETEPQKTRYGILVRWHDYGTGKNVTIKDCNIYDISGRYISQESDYWTDNRFRRFQGDGIIIVSTGSLSGGKQTNYENILIEGNYLNEIYRTGITIWSQWANRPGSPNYDYKSWDTNDYYLFHTTVGAYKASENVVIRNNTLDTIAGDGILINTSKDCLVEYNTVTKCNFYSYDHNAAVWPHNSDGTVMQYNDVSATQGTKDGQSFDFDFLCDSSVLQYNLSRDNVGGFLLVMPNATNSVIRYNISQNDKEGIFHLEGAGNQIYNNTFYMDVPLCRIGSGSGGGATFSNNIFYGSKVLEQLYPSGNSTFVNNIYYQIKNIPQDLNAVKEEPKLTAIGTATNLINAAVAYKPMADSPAINQGIVINNNGGLDYAGTTLDQVQDIGAVDTATPFGTAPEIEEWIVDAKTSVEGWGWGKNRLIDGVLEPIPGGSTNQGYHSAEGNKEQNSEEWVSINFGKDKVMYGLSLYPFTTETFPIDFEIETWDGTNWVTQVTKTGYEASGMSPQIFRFDAPITSSQIRARATKLNKSSDLTDYTLRFTEMKPHLEPWNEENIEDNFDDLSNVIHRTQSIKIEEANQDNGYKNSLLIDPDTAYSKLDSHLLYNLEGADKLKVIGNAMNGGNTDTALRILVSSDGHKFEELTITPVVDGNSYAFEDNNLPEGTNYVKIIMPNGNVQGWEYNLTHVSISKTPSYEVTIEGGAGSGTYKVGSEVTATATVPAGKEFVAWTVNGITLDDASQETVTFTMPAEDVSLLATYRDIVATKYNVTVEGGTGSGSYEAGALVTIQATVPTGKEFVTWAVNGVTLANANIVNTSFTMPGNDVSLTAEYKDVEEEEYNITSGEDSVFKPGSSTGVTIICDGDFDKFDRVEVNGKVVAESNYTKKSGSTIITFKPEYLETLAEGVHNVKMVYVDGEATATITIQRKDGDSNNNPETDKPSTDKPSTDKPSTDKPSTDKPSVDTSTGGAPNTGDTSMIWLYLAMFVLLGSGIVVVGYRKKK